MTTNHTPGPWINSWGHIRAVIPRQGLTPQEPLVATACHSSGLDADANAAFIVRAVNAHDELVAALSEGCGPDYDIAAMRELARRLSGTEGITGNDKESAAQIITEFARFIRVARAALAKVQA